jgi:hypothetical protein
MWGGSYSGLNQWTTAKEFPPHLVSIAPVASPFMGVDFPMRCNIPYPYLTQWLTLVAGRTSQDRMFWGKEREWGERFREWFEAGHAFEELDERLGNPSDAFKLWVAHPSQDSFWDTYNPSEAHYARLCLPVLTITGIYDGDQPGALMHYRKHLENAPADVRERHFLVIGPWDHAGTRAPVLRFAGIEVGSESLLDLLELHRQWYAWTMDGGPRPDFLLDRVAYYVMVADEWRYAPTLEAATARRETLYLASRLNPVDPFCSGTLARDPSTSAPAQYVYDPTDISHAALEACIDPEDRSDLRMTHALVGKQLVYHSDPFDADTELTGFFALTAWLSIDQPDTDFKVSIYDIGLDGTGVLLTADWIRARYRKSLREEVLAATTEPLEYKFERFPFVSRLVRAGHRLRLLIGPVNSIYQQKNYNSGGIVSKETLADARAVTVQLYQDREHPSCLLVPIGRPSS